MISIIDYDAGNIKSVEKAIAFLGEEAKITRDRNEILNSDKVILPGVGSFGVAMDIIKKYELDKIIKEVIALGKPFLGVCLGLQLLFEGSEESNGVEGLDVLKGKIVKFSSESGLKIPQMGWNSLRYPNEGKLFKGIREGSYVYFVHSYYLKAEDESQVVATTEYGELVHAAVEKDNVFACQFHPEKSSNVGIEILRNFISL